MGSRFCASCACLVWLEMGIFFVLLVVGYVLNGRRAALRWSETDRHPVTHAKGSLFSPPI